MIPGRDLLRLLAVVVCLVAGLSRAWPEEYLSNLGNRWIDPSNPDVMSIGDIHTLFGAVGPFAVQFFTGSQSAQTNSARLTAAVSEAIGTNSVSVIAFELNSVTYEFIGGRSQPWSDVSVGLYQKVGEQSILTSALGNPTVNPKPTQWPGSTTYVDYHPPTELLLMPNSEYSVALSVPYSYPPNFGLLFTLSSNYISSADWRMGTTTTHDYWAAGEFLKIAIAATVIQATNSSNIDLSGVRLSAAKVGTNLVLSWPTSAPVCRLYALPSLQPSGWFPVPAAPIVTNDDFVVTLPLAGSACYFRLQLQ